MQKIKIFWRKMTSYQKGLFLVFLTWGSYFAWLFPRTLFRSAEGVWAGGGNVWADWAAHFSLAMPFARGNLIESLSFHPFFWGQKLTYPFLVDAFSGLLIRFGVEDLLSFWLPSLFIALFLLWVLYKTAFHYSRSILQSFLIITIFLASGGLGFVFFLKDFSLDRRAIFAPPQEYTHIEKEGIFYINTVSSEIVPQRTFPLGMALSLLIISFWIGWLKTNFKNVGKKSIFLSGILSGLMPIAHTHSFLVLFLAGGLFFLWNWQNWKKWLLVVLGASLSFLPIYCWFYAGQLSSGFFSWHPGWMANNPPFFGNFVSFWFLNWGIFLPLAFFSAWKTKFFKEPIFVLGLLLFALSNLFLFQPWEWDNSKILTFSHFFLALPVGIYLGRQIRKNFWRGLVAIICLEILTFSGFLDLYRVMRIEERKSLLWSQEELSLAENFRKISLPGDLVLTSDQHNHFIPTLTGARILMSYRGWLLSYGIDFAKVEKDVWSMYSGTAEGDQLLKKYGIKFVVIGPSEKREWQANEKYFLRKYPVVLETSHYKIFKIE